MNGDIAAIAAQYTLNISSVAKQVQHVAVSACTTGIRIKVRGAGVYHASTIDVLEPESPIIGGTKNAVDHELCIHLKLSVQQWVCDCTLLQRQST